MGTLAYERITSEKVGVLLWLLDALEEETDTRLDALRGQAAAARLLGYRAAWLLDRGLDASAASSMAKLSIALLAKRIGRVAVDLLGPCALLEGHEAPLAGRAAALLRAAVGSTLAGGSTEIQRAVIARRQLVA
jgi:alkylation response protein AidB-like acyl-CoA dehydrogenase